MNTRKTLLIIIGTFVFVLLLMNPSESQFKDYVSAHAQTQSDQKAHKLQATREYTFLVGSMFYTRGIIYDGYYIGVAGTFYHWSGVEISNIDYYQRPSEE